MRPNDICSAGPCAATILPFRTLYHYETPPHFSALNQNGTEISNKKACWAKNTSSFYGQDDTPTCNKQVFTANEVADQAKGKGFAVFGVSPDKPAKHKNLWINMA